MKFQQKRDAHLVRWGALTEVLAGNILWSGKVRMIIIIRVT